MGDGQVRSAQIAVEPLAGLLPAAGGVRDQHAATASRLQDGCCVDDELATFQLGAAGLVDWLRASQIDAHIGVITTDADASSPDRAGRLREVDGRRWVETEEDAGEGGRDLPMVSSAREDHFDEANHPYP